MPKPNERVRERRVRRLGLRRGFRLSRSRHRGTTLNINEQGRYRLTTAERGHVVVGERFDADLDDIEELLEAGSSASGGAIFYGWNHQPPHLPRLGSMVVFGRRRPKASDD